MLDKCKYTWVWLAVEQSKVFIDNNVSYTEALVNATSIRYIWQVCYSYFVNTKQLPPLERISVEDKTHVWETAKEIAAGRLNNKKTIELSKALYCLEYVLNLKEWNGTPLN